MLHTECFSLTRPRSVIRDDRNRPYLIDNTSMRRISMGVDVISGHSVCGSASGNAISFIHFFLRLWENFDYIRLRIYIFFPLFFCAVKRDVCIYIRIWTLNFKRKIYGFLLRSPSVRCDSCV